MLMTHFTVFQKEQLGRSLNSYVVASSVGNFSVRDLPEPVRIEIAHLSQRVCVCVCVYLSCCVFVLFLFILLICCTYPSLFNFSVPFEGDFLQLTATLV